MVISVDTAARQAKAHGHSLNQELAPLLIGVTALCPGLVDTNLFDAARERQWLTSRLSPPAFLQVSPDVVAARAIRAIRKNQGLVVITAHARFLWFLRRLSPRLSTSCST